MQVIGNIGNVPEHKVGGTSGKPYVRFSFAENHMGKEYNGPEIPPTWYDITAFPKPEQAALLQKGAFLRLTGRLTPRVYFAKDDVEKAHPLVAMGMIVNKIEEMERRSDQPPREPHAPAPAAQQRPAAAPRQAPAQAPAPRGGSVGFDDMDDDIPF